jgi:hypothetical protein
MILYLNFVNNFAWNNFKQKCFAIITLVFLLLFLGENDFIILELRNLHLFNRYKNSFHFNYGLCNNLIPCSPTESGHRYAHNFIFPYYGIIYVIYIADKHDCFVIIMKQQSPFLVFLFVQCHFRQSDSFNFIVC